MCTCTYCPLASPPQNPPHTANYAIDACLASVLAVILLSFPLDCLQPQTDENTSPTREPPGMKHRSPSTAPVFLPSPRAAATIAASNPPPATTAAAATPTGTAAAGADTADTAPPEKVPVATVAAATTGPSLLDVSVLVASGGWLDLASGKHLQETSGTLCRDCREYIGSHLRVDYSTPRMLWPLRTAGVLLFGGGGGGRGQTLGGGRGGGDGRGGRGLAARSKGKENAGGGSGGGDGWSGSAGGGSRGKGGWVASRHDGYSCGKTPSIPPLRVTMMTWERPLSDLARGRALPAGLQSLSFACSFRYFDVDWVAFPGTLLNLSFPQNFNQVINSIAWPPCLQTLTFG